MLIFEYDVEIGQKVLYASGLDKQTSFKRTGRIKPLKSARRDVEIQIQQGQVRIKSNKVTAVILSNYEGGLCSPIENSISVAAYIIYG